MRILMVCGFFNEEMEYQENLLVRYYVKHGHEVVVITSIYDSPFDFLENRYDPNAQVRSYDACGAHIIRLNYRYNFFNRLRPFTSISKILEERRPELVYVHDISANFPEVIAYKKKHEDVRVIMDSHSDHTNSAKNWLSRWVLHGLFRRISLRRARPHLSKIFPVVPGTAKFLKEVYGVSDGEMEILPLGADIDLRDEVRSTAGGKALRESLGISPEKFVIFSGGKLTPAKRTELIIDAMKLLGNSSLHLVILGNASDQDQEYRQNLERRAEGMEEITFVGWQDRVSVYTHLDMADMAVFPSSQSVLWQQAIAMGLPLLVGDIGGQDISYLNLYENIVILDKDRIDPAHLAQNIATIVGDEALRSRMQAGAERVAKECLDWNHLINRTLRFNRETTNPDRIST